MTKHYIYQTADTVMYDKLKQYAKENKMNIVRRMSGGGTIYTDLGGWQFTFIDRDRDNVIEFKKYISPIIAALKNFGVDADFNGRNDLCIDSKKISGGKIEGKI